MVKVCEQCGTGFQPYHKRQTAKFCSRECYFLSKRTEGGAVCKGCGKWFSFRIRSRGKVKTEFCNRLCAEKNGGRRRRIGFIDKAGYRIISADDRLGTRRGVAEHRFVMEQFLGRRLAPHETVHHKNGVRTDNRLENLELFSSRHGRGQAVGDKLEFARSILTEYGQSHHVFQASEVIAGISGLI